jgi:hypothetical protein
MTGAVCYTVGGLMLLIYQFNRVSPNNIYFIALISISSSVILIINRPLVYTKDRDLTYLRRAAYRLAD